MAAVAVVWVVKELILVRLTHPWVVLVCAATKVIPAAQAAQLMYAISMASTRQQEALLPALPTTVWPWQLLSQALLLSGSSWGLCRSHCVALAQHACLHTKTLETGTHSTALSGTRAALLMRAADPLDLQADLKCAQSSLLRILTGLGLEYPGSP